MSTIAWPGELLPSSESWTIEHADRSGGVSITGSEQIVGSGGGRWSAKLTFALFREEAPLMRAFVARLRGRSRSVYVGPFDLTGVPQASGAPEDFLVAIGALGATQDAPPFRLTVSGTVAEAVALRATSLKVAAPRPVTVGRYLGVGGRLHIVTSVAVEAGAYRCEIEPPLRLALGAGTAVSFDQPRCPMRVATKVDALSFDAATFQTAATLDLVEDF